MGNSQIRTITNPVELLMAQIHEISSGNTDTRKEIERLQGLLKGGQKEEARLQKKLDRLLAAHKSKLRGRE